MAKKKPKTPPPFRVEPMRHDGEYILYQLATSQLEPRLERFPTGPKWRLIIADGPNGASIGIDGRVVAGLIRRGDLIPLSGNHRTARRWRVPQRMAMAIRSEVARREKASYTRGVFEDDPEPFSFPKPPHAQLDWFRIRAKAHA